jgi:hypothetical protein
MSGTDTLVSLLGLQKRKLDSKSPSSQSNKKKSKTKKLESKSPSSSHQIKKSNTKKLESKSPSSSSRKKESLKVIISVNVHGKVIENYYDDGLKKIEVLEFPKNFKKIIWKNKGVCGKTTISKIIGKQQNNTRKNIHDIYVNFIQECYNYPNFNNTYLNYIRETIIPMENCFHWYDCKRPSIDGRVKISKSFNKKIFKPNDLFFLEKCDNGDYVCNSKANEYIDKIYINSKKYVNKYLSFRNESNEDSRGIYISIIKDDKTSGHFQMVDKTDGISINNITDFLGIDILEILNKKNKLANTIDNLLNENVDITFDLLFDFFGSLDYNIDLYLLDYSCSGFGSDINNHQNYNEIMNDNTIAKGGKIRKSQKKKHK